MFSLVPATNILSTTVQNQVISGHGLLWSHMNLHWWTECRLEPYALASEKHHIGSKVVSEAISIIYLSHSRTCSVLQLTMNDGYDTNTIITSSINSVHMCKFLMYNLLPHIIHLYVHVILKLTFCTTDSPFAQCSAMRAPCYPMQRTV